MSDLVQLASGNREASSGPAQVDTGTADTPDWLHASETAYQATDYAAAVAAMQRVVRQSPGDAMLAQLLAHCLDLAGQSDAAEAEYRRALELDPATESAHQALIHICLARSDFDGAIRQIEAQKRYCGPTSGLVNQLSAVLNTAGRPHDALVVVRYHNNVHGATDSDLRYEAELAAHLGYLDQATNAAHAAWLANPDSVATGMLLARLLCADGRFKHATEILARVLELDPGNSDAVTILASAYTEAGEFQQALKLMIGLIAKTPGSAALWHRTAVLANLAGFTKQAAELLDKAAELDPENGDIALLRGQMLAHLHRYSEALLALDIAEKLDPANRSVRDLKISLLYHLGDGPQVIEGGARILPVPRLSKGQRRDYQLMLEGGWRGVLPLMALQLRVLAGLVLREISHRTAMSRLGAASAILEPLAQIAMLGLVLHIFTNGRPPLGTELFFFYATGVLPFYLFIHVIDHNLNIFTDNQNLLQVPLINRLDLVLAVAIAELIIGGATTFLVFAGFYLLGHGERTDNVLQAVEAYVAVWLLALGLGLVLAVLNNFSHMVQRVWTSVQRVLYFVSGVFFLAVAMPEWARCILVWNPLLLGIEWFRTGFFPQYGPPWLDKGYMLLVSGGLILTGLMLERVLRRRMKTA